MGCCSLPPPPGITSSWIPFFDSIVLLWEILTPPPFFLFLRLKSRGRMASNQCPCSGFSSLIRNLFRWYSVNTRLLTTDERIHWFSFWDITKFSIMKWFVFIFTFREAFWTTLKMDTSFLVWTSIWWRIIYINIFWSKYNNIDYLHEWLLINIK